MLVVPKAIADKPQAMTFYNMMDYKPNALLGIIIAITVIIFNTLIILILLIIKTSLSTPGALINNHHFRNQNQNEPSLSC